MRVIVEAGCNWRTMDEALKFIHESKRVGAWATKFQIFRPEDVNHRKDLLPLCLSKNQVRTLFEHGREIGQEVFFTPFFLEAVDWCEEIGVRYYKIRYFDNKNRDLIRKIEDTSQAFFISTNDWADFVDYRFAFTLECVPKYPAKVSDYKLDINQDGISDHTSGIEILKEYGSWFTFFEKHVKLNGTTPIEDKWSISFKQLEEVLNNV